MIYDVCNIFKPINNTNGNFLLFSQYTNDLAKSSVDPGYKVRPSRFVCLNLNNNHVNNLKSWGLSNQDVNYYIPEYFQNFYENSNSYMRTFKGDEYTPFMSSSNFLMRILQMILGDEWSSTNVVNNALSNCIVYDNKIDLESWNDGFADIILNIPSNSSKKSYMLNGSYSSYRDFENLAKYAIGYTQYDNINNQYILGWSSNDNLPISGAVSGRYVTGYDGSKINNGSQYSLFDLLLYSITDDSVESFTFNTILLYYDIIDEHNNPIYINLPMGMYFMGSWDSNNNTFYNPITIRKNVDSALGVGSSWSLRISTKFAPTPRGQLKVEDTAIESGAIVSSLSAIMSANAELIKTINNMSKKTWIDTQSYRDLLAIFKDGRTNIPYIKTINGTDYWFVNGKNTEVPVYQ